MSEIAPIEAYAVVLDGKLNGDYIFSSECSLEELQKTCGDEEIVRVVVIPVAPEKNDAVV